MIETDIEDDIRWHTTETEWMPWDEPWNEDDSGELIDIDEHRKNIHKEFQEIERLKQEDSFRWSLEIDYEVLKGLDLLCVIVNLNLEK